MYSCTQKSWTGTQVLSCPRQRLPATQPDIWRFPPHSCRNWCCCNCFHSRSLRRETFRRDWHHSGYCGCYACTHKHRDTRISLTVHRSSYFMYITLGVTRCLSKLWEWTATGKLDERRNATLMFFSTVHHSIELFNVPTLMHNSLFINNMYVTLLSSTCFEH